MLRIVGIIVFALMLGYAANSLFTMYESGSLFEQYNSQRKARITLFSVAVIVLGSLGSFEIRSLRRDARRRYGEHRYTDEESAGNARGGSSDIYAAPHSVDEWQGRRVSRSKSRRVHKPAPELHLIWMKILRLFCLALPALYIVVFAALYLDGSGSFQNPWIYPAIGASYVSIALITAVGIFHQKSWGLSLGYLLAILNLIVFPVGTAVGLLLLISLVGASPVFVQAAPRSRSRTRSFV